MSEHPEILEAAYKLGVKAKNGVIIIKNKIVAAVRGEKGKQKSKSTVLKSDSKQKSASTILSVATSNEVIAENTDTSKIEGENLSIEEARELVLSILLDYVSMKKKLNRLSNANIKNGKRMELNVEEVVAQLDTLVNRDELNIPMEEQEIPNFIFPRLIEWMRAHGQSDKDIIDCILCICREQDE